MLFLSLALLGQSVALDADKAKAAHQCVTALAYDNGRRRVGPLRAASTLFYIAMAAADAEGVEDRALLERTRIILQDIAASPIDKGERVAACDRRFPLARATAPAPLPADPDERDIVCYFAFITLNVAANGVGGSGGSAADREALAPYMKPFTQRYLTAATKLDSDGGPGFNHLLGRSLRATLARGNSESLFQSCAKLPL